MHRISTLMKCGCPEKCLEISTRIQSLFVFPAVHPRRNPVRFHFSWKASLSIGSLFIWMTVEARPSTFHLSKSPKVRSEEDWLSTPMTRFPAMTPIILFWNDCLLTRFTSGVGRRPLRPFILRALCQPVGIYLLP